jgi:CRISPR-associated protein Cmr5
MKAMRRDQRMAAHAYRCVQNVPPGQRDEYAVAVNMLGPAVLRDGLCAALAFLERDATSAACKQFFKDLAEADIPGLSEGDTRSPEHALPERARHLELDAYMLASREILLVAHWFKRAVQATFVD